MALLYQETQSCGSFAGAIQLKRTNVWSRKRKPCSHPADQNAIQRCETDGLEQKSCTIRFSGTSRRTSSDNASGDAGVNPSHREIALWQSQAHHNSASGYRMSKHWQAIPPQQSCSYALGLNIIHMYEYVYIYIYTYLHMALRCFFCFAEYIWSWKGSPLLIFQKWATWKESHPAAAWPWWQVMVPLELTWWFFLLSRRDKECGC